MASRRLASGSLCRLDARPEAFEQAADAYRRAPESDPDFADGMEISSCVLGAVR